MAPSSTTTEAFDAEQVPASFEKFNTSREDFQNAYKIPDVTYGSPQNRRLKVINIGAGVAGILNAYKIQKNCQNVDFTIYERSNTIGGTWSVNRYPGCACDVPSHAYSFNFALNPEWPSFFSPASDIMAYLEKVCKCFSLKKYMNFESEVLGAQWNEQDGKWIVRILQKQNDGSMREIQDTCDLLLQCTGVLSFPKFPNVPGLQTFKGKVIHTGKWDDAYQKDQWKGENVAVIGSGASSIQTVPGMQPHVKHMDIFVRTPVWFVTMADNDGVNHPYTDEQKAVFAKDKKALAGHASYYEDQINGDWRLFFANSEKQQKERDYYTKRMAEHIKDERLLKGFTPQWAIGCRRVTPGDPYMKAIQEPNVSVHFTGVAAITEDGLIGDDGIERKADTIVCATGFDVSYHPHVPIIGQGGLDLRDKFGDSPKCYLSITIPEFPNYIMYGGPTFPAMNGSAMGPLLAVSEYTIQIIKKMQNENIRSFVPRQDITDEFNAHVQEFLKTSVWVDDCRSWYKNPETGKVFAIWPGSSLHFMQTICTPRYEDYHINYHDGNPWAHLGYGFTVEDRQPELSTAPYLNEDAIDDKWMEQFTR
ncbi:MAG: hypothetical protein M1818_007260 [Claussenomyces sp. TS43310]|nr:MAG: hypothetical protein M1818_007260 [Claussenomyces sp. TS43310]